MKVPFVDFEYRNSVIRNEVLNTFESFFDSKYYVLGPFTSQFEKHYAQFSSTKYACGVSSGLDALILSLMVLDIKKGDEVIVPSNTYIASVLAISHVGAKPVFVEPVKATYNIDPGRIQPAITARTKAILPVHLYGQPCEMSSIKEIADEYNLFIVEDNAQSQGAFHNGKITGSFGNINATSFYPTKNLGAIGEAGMITTDSKELDSKVRALRNYGAHERYKNTFLGYNNRIDEFESAFLTTNLKYLNRWNEDRVSLANYYTTGLSGVGDLVLPITKKNNTHVYHQFVIRTHYRNQLQSFLKENGIETIIHYPIPPHLQKCYAFLGHNIGDFPIAEMMSNEMLSLPIYPGLQLEKQDYAIATIKKFYETL
jgi:dTDP-4-amino-4,6-dideoxygalactose transaminase